MDEFKTESYSKASFLIQRGAQIERIIINSATQKATIYLAKVTSEMLSEFDYFKLGDIIHIRNIIKDTVWNMIKNKEDYKTLSNTDLVIEKSE